MYFNLLQQMMTEGHGCMYGLAAEKMSNSKEENDRNLRNVETSRRSDS